MNGNFRSIPDLVGDLSEMSIATREHRNLILNATMPGVPEGEKAELDKILAKAEDDILAATCNLHQATGILLNASVRWRAREALGQDPTKEETKQ
jgi:hypothetical protein